MTDTTNIEQRAREFLREATNTVGMELNGEEGELFHDAADEAAALSAIAAALRSVAQTPFAELSHDAATNHRYWKHSGFMDDLPVGRYYHAAPPASRERSERIVLTSGQIAQLAAFAGRDDEPFDDQATLVIQHCADGHSGLGIYAYYEDLPDEGSMLLDGAWPATTAPHEAAQEPVIAECVGVVKDDSECGNVVDWLLEGGIDAIEQGDHLYVINAPAPPDGAMTLYAHPAPLRPVTDADVEAAVDAYNAQIDGRIHLEPARAKAMRATLESFLSRLAGEGA